MKVCFIGHRTVPNEEQLKIRLTETVSNLIADGADFFIFGSKSDFDDLCWEVVTELKKQFPDIKRVKYALTTETAFTSTDERLEFEQLMLRLTGEKIEYKDYERAVFSSKAQSANRYAYIMRNQEMIDDSDVCVFYYDKDYLPPRRKLAKRFVVDYQPKSGAALAFLYALQKNKKIINMADDCSV